MENFEQVAKLETPALRELFANGRLEQLVGDDMDLLVAIVREKRITIPVTALARAALDGHAHPLVERLGDDLALIDAPTDELRPLLPLLEHHYGEWIAALDRAIDSERTLPASTDDNEDYAKARATARTQLAKLQKQLRRLMR